MKPLISVVMAVYNNEIYFPLAAKSVLNQSFKDIELIIVDDGSTDRTGEIADNIASDDNRVSVIHQDNQWIYASFNNGIKAAHGKYIYIVNSDDLLVEGALEMLAKVIQEKKYPDIVYTPINYAYCNEKQECYKVFSSNKDIKEILYLDRLDKNPEVILRLIKDRYLQDQANLYKRELMIKCPFRNDFYAADVFFNYEVIQYAKSIVAIDKPIYIHYIYDDINMNVANKKYKGYEQYMYNEVYLEAKKMISFFGIYDEGISYFISKRKNQFSAIIRCLLEDTTYKDLYERLNDVFEIHYGDVERECFEFGGTNEEGREEFEARIICELRRYFAKLDEPIDHFSYKLVESLLHYEYDENDLKTVEECVYHELNPNHIGELFYLKMKKTM